MLITGLISTFQKLAIGILILVPVVSDGQATRADTLFLSDEIIIMELRSDFSAIQKDRSGNPENHEGVLIYQSPDGKAIKLKVKVMARGDFRRDPANCNFPPLALNFKENEVKNTLFENQDKLKLVTPCEYDKYVIGEYLIYKMYNQLTDRSFKVRLVKILYFDTGNNKKLFEKYSFFIEHEDQVAERNNSVEVSKILTPYDLDSDNFRKTAFFQYMIGNKDWFITSRRNVFILKPNDVSFLPFAIPYDFDFAAFVNAEYTKPKDVPDDYLETRRIYKGLCYSMPEYNEVIATFKSLRPVFESIIRGMTLLQKSVRDQELEYLKSFYKIIESSTMIKQEFIDKCESRKDYNLPDIQGK